MRPNTLLAIILISAALGAAGGFYATRFAYGESLEKIGLLTPVVVLDPEPALRALPITATSEDIGRIMTQAREKAKRLEQGGFVVIKPSAVWAVPEEVHVRVQRPSEP